MASLTDIRATESRLAADLAWDAAARRGDDDRLRRLVQGASASVFGFGALWLALRWGASLRVTLVAIATGGVTATLLTATAPGRETHRAQVVPVVEPAGPADAARPDRKSVDPATLPALSPMDDAAPLGLTPSLAVAPLRPRSQGPMRAPMTAVVGGVPVPAPLGASALLAAANAARASQEIDRAIDLYAALATEHPDSREAAIGCVAHGRLLLRRSSASTAEQVFAVCIARHPAGVLLEEALVGRADALHALHRGDAERAVWTELLRRFPDSLHADRARGRLVR